MKTAESQIIRPRTSDKDMTHRLLLQALRVKVVFVPCCFNEICPTVTQRRIGCFAGDLSVNHLHIGIHTKKKLKEETIIMNQSSSEIWEKEILTKWV